MSEQHIFDVIVVGGGHAGAEASLAAARLGCKTLLLTGNLDTIAQMSCNPAIGGIAKGHLVREIDALGGEMAINTDVTGLHFRMLNTKKGPSVRAPRAQCDKKAYQFRMKRTLETEPSLQIKQCMVAKLVAEDRVIAGVITTDGRQFRSATVVLTTGTFLNGLIHIGRTKLAAGRACEAPATHLSDSLTECGFQLGRFKTGTPPRVRGSSIDWSMAEPQPGDSSPCYFSYLTRPTFHVEQIHCYLTHTTESTEKIIRANIAHSALYSGQISGTGPRYCPSIEDKVMKFPEKPKHQIFLEPEGRNTDEVYVNGASMSMPETIQLQVLRSIPCLANVEIVRPAYAIEYDFVLPHQLHASLETKHIQGLYMAGQINGTSGYEEAAAQGILAGINAAMKARGRSEVILDRSSSYIGVMINDLVTRSTDEPYRIFTSRAEHRLQLRQDNADERLTPIGHQIGLVTQERWRVFLAKQNVVNSEISRLGRTLHHGVSLAELLRRPEMSYDDLPGAHHHLTREAKELIETCIKYQGYIQRERDRIERFKSVESKQIPVDLDYSAIPSLRFESRQRLIRIRPDTIGQAAKIPGITPADIAVLLIYLRRIELSLGRSSIQPGI